MTADAFFELVHLTEYRTESGCHLNQRVVGQRHAPFCINNGPPFRNRALR